jgi:hypothetical protein
MVEQAGEFPSLIPRNKRGGFLTHEKLCDLQKDVEFCGSETFTGASADKATLAAMTGELFGRGQINVLPTVPSFVGESHGGIVLCECFVESRNVSGKGFFSVAMCFHVVSKERGSRERLGAAQERVYLAIGTKSTFRNSVMLPTEASVFAGHWRTKSHASHPSIRLLDVVLTHSRAIPIDEI